MSLTRSDAKESIDIQTQLSNAGVAFKHQISEVVKGLNSESEQVQMKSRAVVGFGVGLTAGMMFWLTTDLEMKTAIMMSMGGALVGTFLPQIKAQAPVVKAYCQSFFSGKKKEVAVDVVDPAEEKMAAPVLGKKAM